MDLWQLQVFCKVIEKESFSRAGREVHLTQPTVSSHIKELEAHFGCRLIDRLARRAVPTRAGRLLYGYAQRLLALRDETESALAEHLGTVRGRLVVGGSTIPGAYLLPRLIGGFTRAFPEVTVSLVLGDTETITARTREGELEASIVGARSARPGVEQERLLEDEMRLIVPAGHPWERRRRVSWKMLAAEPFIVREPGSGTMQSLRRSLAVLDRRLDDLRVVAEMGSTQAVYEGIKGGVGVSILSALAVADDLEAGRVRALTVQGLNMRRWFYLTRSSSRSLSPLGRTFTEFVRRRLARPEPEGQRRNLTATKPATNRTVKATASRLK